jgi:hypothetical protein
MFKDQIAMVVYEACRGLEEANGRSSPPWREAPSPIIDSVMSIVHAHYDNDIGAEELHNSLLSHPDHPGLDPFDRLDPSVRQRLLIARRIVRALRPPLPVKGVTQGVRVSGFDAHKGMGER